MSLIFGINLSDRVMIASDTRLTFVKHGTQTFKDCICKNGVVNNDIMVAAAGDVRLSKFLFKELIKEEFIKHGINTIEEKIYSWAAKKIDNYLAKNPYSRACLIIAGMDRSRKKTINGKKYIELVGHHQDLRKDVPLAMKDAVFKGISAKPHQPNPNPELPVSDSSVIALLSDAKNSILKVEKAKWGEFLAYGPQGFTKEDVPKTLFGQLEFESGDIFRDGSLLTAFIKSTAEQKKLGSVGGSVVINAATENGVILIASTVHRLSLQTYKEEIVSSTKIVKGKLYAMSQSGEMVRLINFYDYPMPDGKARI